MSKTDEYIAALKSFETKVQDWQKLTEKLKYTAAALDERPLARGFEDDFAAPPPDKRTILRLEEWPSGDGLRSRLSELRDGLGELHGLWEGLDDTDKAVLPSPPTLTKPRSA